MPRGTTIKTPERLAQARQMRNEGQLLRQIAARFGVTPGAIHTWLVDPDGEIARARKDSYRGTCIDCGKPTDGSAGRNKGPTRCNPCQRTRSRKDGEAYIIASIQEWAQLFGDPPSAVDWNRQLATAQSAPWRIQRYDDTGRPWPSVPSAQYLFGSWSKAIGAAGYEPLKPGERRDPEGHREALLDYHAARRRAWQTTN